MVSGLVLIQPFVYTDAATNISLHLVMALQLILHWSLVDH